MFDCCVLSVSCSPWCRTVAIQICHRWKNNCCLFILISLVVDSGNINGRSRSFIVNCCQHGGGGATNSNVLVVAVVLIRWPVIVNHCYGRKLLDLRLSLSVKGSMIITNDLNCVPYDLLRSNGCVSMFYSS
jgi:hypothetical protein